MTDRHQFGFDTLAIHAGQRPDPETGARAQPIYATSSFVFEDAQQAADLFALQTYGNLYSRIGNPTVAAFEERIAALEGGLGAVATGSGLAAQLIAILTLAQNGDEVVASQSLYGGTHTQFDVTLRRLGIVVTFVDFSDVEAVKAAITDKTKLLYSEIIGNPRADVLDVSTIADIAHDHDIPLVVDSTFATPYLCRPIEHGADIVVHSATKFISGHGTVIAGVIVEAGTFPFDNGKFPLITDPSPAYHGLTFWDNFREYAFLTRARTEVLRDVGAALSAFDAFQLLIGLETLPLRMQRHAENAKAVAEYLRGHEQVEWVSFPIFDDNKFTPLAEHYLPEGPGAVFAFGIKGGYEAAKKFIASVELASHLANIGDSKTLIIHPASTTHQQVPDEARDKAGVGNDLIRISVGIETLDDIIWDLDQALSAAKEVA